MIIQERSAQRWPLFLFALFFMLTGKSQDLPAGTPPFIRDSLDAFVEMGLGYLSLDRPSGTLSGGEAQRTRMIRHLGSPLTDVTYVFDEPTIGLHAHDVERTNALLERLRDKGNTVLVVEHDPETIVRADRVIDLGPGAGRYGGIVLAAGTPAEITMPP